MKKSFRLAVLFSAVCLSTVPSFAAMGGCNPRPPAVPGAASVVAGMIAAARAFVGI